MIGIVDYGVGNLNSLQNMCKHIGIDSFVSDNQNELLAADGFILPGVGRFDYGMKSLTESGLLKMLESQVMNEKKPVLGVCLGMQLLTNKSEEGNKSGLGWIDAETKKFPKYEEYKVPHMGWNLIKHNKRTALLSNLNNQDRFYFVHSYYVSCRNREDALAKTHYILEFDSIIAKGNVYGVQFHPEKSHKFGMNVLRGYNEIVMTK